MIRGSRGVCGSGGSAARPDGPGSTSTAAPCSRPPGRPSAAGRMAEIEPTKSLGGRPLLRVDQLQFVPRGEDQRRSGLGAHADPVEAAGGGWVPLVSTATWNPAACSASTAASSSCSSGSPPVQTTSGGARGAGRPGRRDRGGQSRGRREPAPARSVGADEIGVAEGAGGVGAVAPRARSRDCTPRNGRTPPAVRRWRLRPAACRRSPSRRSSCRLVPRGIGADRAWRNPSSLRWQASHRPQEAPSGEGS